MAIAFDATASGGLTVGATSLSWNHTLASGAILLVGLFEATGGSEQVTGVAWDSAGTPQALTKIGSAQVPSDRWVSLWVLTNPSVTGTKQITITAGSTIAMRGDSSSFTGCSTTQPDSFGTNTVSSAATFPLTTTVVASSCWLVGVIKNQNANLTVDFGTTRQGGNDLYLWDSNGTVSTGSQGPTWTCTAGPINWAGVIAAIQPAGGGGGGGGSKAQSTLTLMGVQ